MYSAKIQVCTGSGKSHPPTPVSSQKSSRNGVLFSGLYRWEVRNNIAVETKARPVSLTYVKDFKPRRFLVFRLFCGEYFRQGMRRKRSGRFEKLFLSPKRCVECDFCRNTKHTFPELRSPLYKFSARFRIHLFPPEMLLHKIADPIFRLFWHYGFFCAKISVKH